MKRIVAIGLALAGLMVLAAVGPRAPGHEPGKPEFKAAIAQYPGCRVQSRLEDWKPYLPLLVFAATDDEVSPWVCQELAQEVKARGGSIEFVLYAGAHHAYDDPGKRKQDHEPNRAALADTRARAAAFFGQQLR